jgi:hypothetical protein
MVVRANVEWKENKETLKPLRRSRIIFHVRKDFSLLDDDKDIKEIAIYAATSTHVFGFLVLFKRHAYSYFVNRLFTGSRGLRLFPITKHNPIAQLRKAQFKPPWWVAAVRTEVAAIKRTATPQRKIKADSK